MSQEWVEVSMHFWNMLRSWRSGDWREKTVTYACRCHQATLCRFPEKHTIRGSGYHRQHEARLQENLYTQCLDLHFLSLSHPYPCFCRSPEPYNWRSSGLREPRHTMAMVLKQGLSSPPPQGISINIWRHF